MKSKTIEELEAELKVNKPKLQSIFNNLPLGVIVYSSDTKIIRSNIEAERILGLTGEQLLGKQAMDPEFKFVYKDKSIMRLKDYPIKKIISTGEDIKNYFIGINNSDKKDITWVLVNSTSLNSKNGELEEIIINFTDITELEKTRKENEKYVQILLHDLTNNSSVIKSALKMFLMLTAVENIHDDHLEFLNEAIKRNNNNVNFVKKIIKGKEANLLENITLNSYNGNNIILNEFKHRENNEKGITFIYNLNKNISYKIENLQQEDDDITRVITNLTKNSYENASRGTKITCGLKIIGKYLEYKFTNNNLIPEEILNEDGTCKIGISTNGEGRGLGLTSVYEILNKIGGTLKYKRNLRYNTTTTILRIPLNYTK